MIDHLLWGVPELDRGIDELMTRAGVRARRGGRHPDAGTHNALLDLGAGRYLELIARDPDQDRLAGFGRLLAGLETPALVTWAARVDDLETTAAAARDAGLEPGEITAMSRRRPDGSTLAWRLMTVGGHGWGPLLPFFLDWGDARHPSRDAPAGCTLERFALSHPRAAELGAVLAALGLEDATVENGPPGLRAVLETPRGRLVLAGRVQPPAA